MLRSVSRRYSRRPLQVFVNKLCEQAFKSWNLSNQSFSWGEEMHRLQSFIGPCEVHAIRVCALIAVDSISCSFRLIIQGSGKGENVDEDTKPNHRKRSVIIASVLCTTKSVISTDGFRFNDHVVCTTSYTGFPDGKTLQRCCCNGLEVVGEAQNIHCSIYFSSWDMRWWIAKLRNTRGQVWYVRMFTAVRR